MVITRRFAILCCYLRNIVVLLKERLSRKKVLENYVIIAYKVIREEG
jgi:hypothetical protein